MANFIGLVYATLKEEGIDTSKLSTDEAVKKFKELKGGESESPDDVKKKLNGETKEETTKESLDNVKKKLNGEKISNKEQEKVNYLIDKINNSWYKNAKIDYGIEGKVKDISVKDDKMTIIVEENGKTLKSTINYISDYTPEQLYNIWQEYPED